jgi:hypothetical protein
LTDYARDFGIDCNEMLRQVMAEVWLPT